MSHFEPGDGAALAFHRYPKPGKLDIRSSKPLVDARDLSLAYSPGVADPVDAIVRDPAGVYDYTGKGNLVAVITNGTAVLGLGNVGVAAAKPVMEGKAALFKRFADVDAIDIGLQTSDVDLFVETVRLISSGFGGINLEDIAAPACFLIEQRLQAQLDIPVFHDDQHGTAIVVLAGLINACAISGRDLSKAKIVVNGAGAAALSCVSLMRSFGVPSGNIVVCDLEGIVHKGRLTGMDPWKAAVAMDHQAGKLHDALLNADVLLGLSAGNCVTPDMLRSMRPCPIVFAMANPTPEIAPELALDAVPKAIVATGRSDYPNQINNLLCFPFLFRGALDVRASCVTLGMKIAASRAIANLALQEVDQTHGKSIIPSPFNHRLSEVAVAVAQAAVADGVSQKPVCDWDCYKEEVADRLASCAIQV